MDTTLERWYVIRAYKNEKKAEDILSGENGLDFFIPKRYALRVYHGVKSKRLIPAIPSLLFVHASQEQILDLKHRHGFLQFVMCKRDGKLEYMVVPDGQMDSFIKVASAYEEEIIFYTPDEINIEKGTPVRIHGGKFDQVEGVFMQVKGKRNRRLVVWLEGIMAASVEVHPDLVEVLKSIK